MIEIGRFNALEVIEEQDFGVYLDGDKLGRILLPKSAMPINCKIGDDIKVFIYFDSEDRIIATTKKPNIQVGEFGKLKVVSTSTIGAFLDWGLTKDLFVPFKEQREKMQVGNIYLVHCFYDKKSNRIAASASVDKFFNYTSDEYVEEQEVDLIVCTETNMGYKAIINRRDCGVLYKNEIFQKVEFGQEIKGYIKKIREDGKFDLSLDKPGPQRIDKISQLILDKLKENDGFLNVTDKSSPEIISEMFGVSKKTYKRAIGALYKRKHIVLEKNGIKLISN